MARLTGWWRNHAPLLVTCGLLWALVKLADGSVIPAWSPLAPYRTLLANAVINIIVVSGLVLINGLCGQLSLGHAGFMCVGAYSAALLTTAFPEVAPGSFAGLLLMVAAMLVGGVMAAAVGWLVGKPTLRLRGDYLAIVTLAFAEVIRSLVRASDEFAALLTELGWPALGGLVQRVNGPRGMAALPALADFGLLCVVLFVALASIRNFIYSTHGRACTALRDDELAAGTLGVDTARYATLAFTAAAFWAGIGGALYAHLFGFIHLDNFSFLKTIDYLIYLYVGGMNSFSGVVVATGALSLLPEQLRNWGFEQWRLVVYPLVLIVLMLVRPAGLFGRREFFPLKPDKRRAGDSAGAGR